jgi:cell division protease FtsH
MNVRNLTGSVIIALLLVATFYAFQGNEGRSRHEISYSDFLAGVEAGNITEVTIQKYRIEGNIREKGKFTTFAPPTDTGLIERLYKKNVKMTVRPPDDDGPSLLGLMATWFPMLLLIGVWIFFERQMRSGGGQSGGGSSGSA